MLRCIKLGRITVAIPDELEAEFRQVLGETLGFKKGNLKIAIEEAIQDWVKGKKSKEQIPGRMDRSSDDRKDLGLGSLFG